jgi:hypothetical protein
MSKPQGFADLADLPEDERIRLIAGTAEQGHIVGFVVDDEPKADRYIKKLAVYPVRFIDRSPGPVKGTVLVRVGPKES